LFEVEENEVECYSAICYRLMGGIAWTHVAFSGGNPEPQGCAYYKNCACWQGQHQHIGAQGEGSIFLLNVSNFYHFDMVDFLVNMNHQGSLKYFVILLSYNSNIRQSLFGHKMINIGSSWSN
jgi:hypothetical protein